MDEKKISGALGFEKEYWQYNYSDPSCMDGIGNAKEHVQYMRALFNLEFIDISSVIDFGFGLGHLFEEVLKEFIPYKAVGIEPSEYAYNVVKKRGIAPVESTKLKLYKEDLVNWSSNSRKGETLFDLGLCTSVFQYLTDQEIERVVPILAQRVRYLYFSVPTDKELVRQVDELGNNDVYAIKRSRAKYHKLLRTNFTFISSRLLESKVHYNEMTTSFSDLLFRY